MRNKILVLILGSLFLFLGTQSFAAVSFDVFGINTDVSANIEFAYDGINRIDITLENTTDPSYGGIATGFAFNLPTGVTDMTAGTPFATGWNSEYNPNSILATGALGYFDGAGYIPPNLLGGNPNSGIGEGASADFNFVLTGDATFLASLTETSFLDLLSVNGDRAEPFMVRFQGVGPGGGLSDVAVVPIPGAVWLLGSGLLGLVGLRARRKK